MFEGTFCELDMSDTFCARRLYISDLSESIAAESKVGEEMEEETATEERLVGRGEDTGGSTDWVLDEETEVVGRSDGDEEDSLKLKSEKSTKYKRRESGRFRLRNYK